MSRIIKVYKGCNSLDNTKVSVYNEVKKYNPYHGADGRFASANGMAAGGSFALPKNSKNLKNATIPEGVRVFSGEGAKGKRAVTTSIGTTIEGGKVTGGATKPEATESKKPEEKRDYKERTVREADEILRKETAKYWNEDWTDAEKFEMYDYTEASLYFNNPVRDGKTNTKIETLTAAINKTSLPTDMITYRGTSEWALNTFLQLENESPEKIFSMKDEIIGKTFSDKGFISTTLDTDSYWLSDHQSVVYTIKVPKGTKAAYVEPFSCYGHTKEGLKWDGRVESHTPIGNEAELLLQRNTSFKVSGMKLSENKKQIFIDMEVTGQE